MRTTTDAPRDRQARVDHKQNRRDGCRVESGRKPPAWGALAAVRTPLE
jgi:hypothetical protein